MFLLPVSVNACCLQIGTGANGRLLVANANKDASKIFVFSGCDSDGSRTLVKTLISTDTNAGYCGAIASD